LEIGGEAMKLLIFIGLFALLSALAILDFTQKRNQLIIDNRHECYKIMENKAVHEIKELCGE
jgi:hypothetical protein